MGSASLLCHKLLRPAGLEPATSWSATKCSNPLSYERISARQRALVYPQVHPMSRGERQKTFAFYEMNPLTSHASHAIIRSKQFPTKSVGDNKN